MKPILLVKIAARAVLAAEINSGQQDIYAMYSRI